jgi:hypothetical protein
MMTTTDPEILKARTRNAFTVTVNRFSSSSYLSEVARKHPTPHGYW